MVCACVSPCRKAMSIDSFDINFSVDWSPRGGAKRFNLLIGQRRRQLPKKFKNSREAPLLHGQIVRGRMKIGENASSK